ncbi:MAG: hypothetical protein JWQ32_2426 [Marmoricola sp.]|nr:hypothetical protein [Marmoricola sp.]
MIAAVVVLRMLMLRHGPTPDEGGYLALGSQWHSGGHELYGHYWVDRPPLLITIFAVAAHTGGFVSLEIIGALAASMAIALLASAGGRAFGTRGRIGTAVVAGALLASPLYGAIDVNGELLAVPFLALGIRLAVEAVQPVSDRRRWISAAGAGAAAVAALLVKQNMADVVVFAAVCWGIAWRTGTLTRQMFVRLVGLAALGSIACYLVVTAWAMLHGTSPGGVYEATYPFRLKAARAIAVQGDDATGIQLGRMTTAFLRTGVPLVLAAFAVLGLRRSTSPAVALGVAVTLLYTAVSILAGGSYWLHYLVESVPAVALGAGALIAVAPRVYSVVTAVVIASTLVAMVTAIRHPLPIPGTVIGQALAASAHRGDTVVPAFGGGDIVFTSGLSSPYPYLWSLPADILDHDMTQLTAVLAGPSAPTWIVVRGPAAVGRMSAHGAMSLIRSQYAQVARVCGRAIYLRLGLVRPPVVGHGPCTGRLLP